MKYTDYDDYDSKHTFWGQFGKNSNADYYWYKKTEDYDGYWASNSSPYEKYPKKVYVEPVPEPTGWQAEKARLEDCARLNQDTIAELRRRLDIREHELQVTRSNYDELKKQNDTNSKLAQQLKAVFNAQLFVSSFNFIGLEISHSHGDMEVQPTNLQEIVAKSLEQTYDLAIRRTIAEDIKEEPDMRGRVEGQIKFLQRIVPTLLERLNDKAHMEVIRRVAADSPTNRLPPAPLGGLDNPEHLQDAVETYCYHFLLFIQTALNKHVQSTSQSVSTTPEVNTQAVHP